MALIYTLTAGTLLWWIGSGTVDTRYTMGVGGPWVYAFVLAFVAGMTVWVERRRHLLSSTTGWMRCLVVAIGFGLALGFVAGIGMQANAMPGGLFVLVWLAFMGF